MPDILRYIEKYIEFRYDYDMSHEDAIRYAARETYARASAKTAPTRAEMSGCVHTHMPNPFDAYADTNLPKMSQK